jgi:hypothetical protein
MEDTTQTTVPLWKRLQEASAELEQYAQHVAETYGLTASVASCNSVSDLTKSWKVTFADPVQHGGKTLSPEQIEFQALASKRHVPEEWYRKIIKSKAGYWKIIGLDPSPSTKKNFVKVMKLKNGVHETNDVRRCSPDFVKQCLGG